MERKFYLVPLIPLLSAFYNPKDIQNKFRLAKDLLLIY